MNSNHNTNVSSVCPGRVLTARENEIDRILKFFCEKFVPNLTEKPRYEVLRVVAVQLPVPRPLPFSDNLVQNVPKTIFCSKRKNHKKN